MYFHENFVWFLVGNARYCQLFIIVCLGFSKLLRTHVIYSFVGGLTGKVAIRNHVPSSLRIEITASFVWDEWLRAAALHMLLHVIEVAVAAFNLACFRLTGALKHVLLDISDMETAWDLQVDLEFWGRKTQLCKGKYLGESKTFMERNLEPVHSEPNWHWHWIQDMQVKCLTCMTSWHVSGIIRHRYSRYV